MPKFRRKFPTADGPVDMVPTVVENYDRLGLDALIMLGGGGTAKNAMRLANAGLRVIHLPKTIDNDIALTDTTFGFATALEIATEAIDRVHSTAHSHHRIILTEIMGHRAGWLTLGAGIAGATIPTAQAFGARDDAAVRRIFERIVDEMRSLQKMRLNAAAEASSPKQKD